jgi:hypothetical protein
MRLLIIFSVLLAAVPTVVFHDAGLSGLLLQYYTKGNRYVFRFIIDSEKAACNVGYSEDGYCVIMQYRQRVYHDLIFSVHENGDFHFYLYSNRYAKKEKVPNQMTNFLIHKNYLVNFGAVNADDVKWITAEKKSTCDLCQLQAMEKEIAQTKAKTEESEEHLSRGGQFKRANTKSIWTAVVGVLSFIFIIAPKWIWSWRCFGNKQAAETRE